MHVKRLRDPGIDEAGLRVTGTAPLRWAWPAYVSATALFVYAVGKGWYATQGKLGVPGGPKVPESAYAELPQVALRQWTLASVGLLGGLLALATVLPWAAACRGGSC